MSHNLHFLVLVPIINMVKIYVTEIPYHLHFADKCDITSNVTLVASDSEVSEDLLRHFAMEANGPVIRANLSSEIELRSTESFQRIFNQSLKNEVLHLVPNDLTRTKSDRDCRVAVVTEGINNVLMTTMTKRMEFANAVAEMNESAVQKEMSHVKLRIVLKYVSPHIKLPDGWQGGSENVTGYFIDVVHILQKSLGFDFEFVPGTDGFWGSKNEDGTWNGVVGMVVREEADLIGCPLSITLERSEVLSYTAPIFTATATGLIKKVDRPTIINLWVFLNFFYIETLVLIFVVAFVLAVFFFAINLNELGHVGRINGFSVVYLAILQIGSDVSPRSLSHKMLLLCVYGYGFLIFAHYSADLTTTMTVQPKGAPFKTFEDIANSDYSVKIFKGNNLHSLLINADKDKSISKMYHAKIKDEPDSMLTGVHHDEVNQMMLANDKIIMFDYKESFVDYPTLKGLKLEDEIPSDQTFAFKKGSPYADIFSFQIKKLREQGTLQKMRNKWFSQGPEPMPGSEGPIVATVLGFENLLFPFLILFVGSVSGLVISTVEKLYSHKARPQK